MKRKRYFQLFAMSGPLQCTASYIRFPLQRTENGNEIVTVMTDHYWRITRAILTSEKTATHVANVFLAHRIPPQGIPIYLLMGYGPQLVNTLFGSFSGFRNLNLLTTTAHYLQTDGRIEKYIRAIIPRLRCYVAEHKDSLDIYFHALTYA